jgi:hypothetical protein
LSISGFDSIHCVWLVSPGKITFATRTTQDLFGLLRVAILFVVLFAVFFVFVSSDSPACL